MADMSRLVVLLSFCLVAFVCCQEQRDPERAALQVRDPFCPLERNQNKCRARRNQFKCGAFLMDLAGQNETIRWLGALPDMLHKPRVRQSRQLMKNLGNVHRRSFQLINGFCNEIFANRKCFGMMEKLSKVPLDSCEVNMMNEFGNQTLGNILCGRAAAFAPGQHFQSFVSIGFYHSACGGEWTETHRREEHLVMEEELCCRFDEGQGVYFRCDGSHYEKLCPGVEEPKSSPEEVRQALGGEPPVVRAYKRHRRL